MFWLGLKFDLLEVICFSPAFVFCTAWFLSFSLYLTGDHFLGIETALNLSLFILAFVFPGLVLILIRNARGGIRKEWLMTVSNFKIKPIAIALFICQSGALISAWFYLNSAIQHIGGGGVDDLVFSAAAIRGVMATEQYDVPLFIRLLGQLKYVNYIAPVAFLALWIVRREGGWLFVLSIFLGMMSSVILLERSGVLRLLVINVVVYIYLSTDRFRSLRNGCAILLLIFIPLVFIVPALRGQGDEGGDNIYGYVVGGLAGINAFIEGTSGSVDILEEQPIYVTTSGYKFGDAPIGLETATEIYRLCNALHVCDIPIPNGKEYIYSPIMTNIYTGLRSFYQDFGPLGMPLGVVCFSLFIHFLYLRFVSGSGVFGLFGIGYLAYVSSFMILTNNFLFRDLIFTAVLCLVIPGLGRNKSAFWWNSRRFSSVVPGVRGS